MPWRMACVGEVDLDHLAVDLDGAARRRRHAEHRLGDVRAAGADQAGNAEDFARAHVERHVVEDALRATGP